MLPYSLKILFSLFPCRLRLTRLTVCNTGKASGLLKAGCGGKDRTGREGDKVKHAQGLCLELGEM